MAMTLCAFAASSFAQMAATTPSTQPDIPTGETTKYSFANSRIFPGTVRDYWIYVPREYRADKSACLVVDQDDVQFHAPAVFDRLIHDGQMPVTIAVFVAPGKVKALSPAALDRFNRSYEFDTLGDSYVRFLLEELLPEVEKKTAGDGRAIRISHVANDRAIMGSSSGAICAFTAAWERPDAFSRVFSAIGTFVDLRGGNIYPSLIRKYEPKPIRIFLQDGSADHNIYGGDWWMANQEMERALTYAGYDVNHAWGTGDHDHKQADAIFPDVMKWLWKDWPAPVKAGLGSEQLRQILIAGEGWQDVESGPDSGVIPTGLANGRALGPDGRIHRADEQLRGNRLVMAANGGAYVTQAPAGTDPGALWYIAADGKKRVVDKGLKCYSGVTLSPDQSLLYVADARSHWVYSYQIQPDGTVADKQKFFDLYVPDCADDAAAGGMCTDRDGRLYVATAAGVQVCDQAGRVICIMPTPAGKAVEVAFGGATFDTLYAACGEKLYMRKTKVVGSRPFQAPIKPALPKL